MTGPPYPRYVPGTGPGENAIGDFIIGTSPIGTIPDFDYWTTVISQYANSPILMQLVDNFFQYVNQTANFDLFFDMIWNVDTAQGPGLDVWGRIVNVSRTLQVTFDGKYFGYQEAGDISADPFNQSPFYAGSPLTQNFTLSDDAYRTLIFAKALANISTGTIPAINQILLNLFPGRGNGYVTDGQDMTMTYTFEFGLQPFEVAILEQSGVLPKPVGVSAVVVQV